MQKINIEKYAGKSITLPESGSWEQTKHLFTEHSLYALNAAIASNRPLLIRGEPGTGKSQLARAAAQILERLLISEVVHARCECQDLQWHYDAVGRLGDAQIAAVSQQLNTKPGNDVEDSEKDNENNQADPNSFLDEKNYLSPGPLWWAFDYEGAAKHCNTYLKRQLRQPPIRPEFNNESWNPENGCVLLIDEIDKADVDLPNGLLETLGNGAFSVPYLNEVIGHKEGVNPSLVIITTNEERALPAAFIRRCMVLHLSLPEDDLANALIKVGKVHYGDKTTDGVFIKVAEYLIKDRKDAKDAGLPVPGQAEYIDILKVLTEMNDNEADQLLLLDKIKDFALKKQSEE